MAVLIKVREENDKCMWVCEANENHPYEQLCDVVPVWSESPIRADKQPKGRPKMVKRLKLVAYCKICKMGKSPMEIVNFRTPEEM